jgi:hypothetical protein
MAALPQYDFYDEMMRRVPTLRKQAEPGEASAHAKNKRPRCSAPGGLMPKNASGLAVAGARRSTHALHGHLNRRSEFSSSSAGTFTVMSG